VSEHRILIIDDDRSRHILLERHLQPVGYEVLHAKNGTQGLTLLEEKKPDLILLDVRMPGMDGFQVIQKIKANRSTQSIPVVFMTSMDTQEFINRGLELGADDFIVVPYDRGEMLARISAILRRSVQNRKIEGAMEGDLSELGISDLLQSLAFGLKTAVVHMKDMDADIMVKDGNLLHVRQGAFTGQTAMLRIFLLEKGYFTVRFNEIPPDISGPGDPLEAVLMNVANDVDEILDVVKKLGVGNRKMILTGDLSEFPLLEKVRAMTPATFIEIISAMEGHPKENIWVLSEASRKRAIKIEKKPKE
jgi:DNA-binding response OmpR family regulator